MLGHLTHFYGIVPTLVCILMKLHGSGKYLLKTRGNAIFDKIQNVPRCLGPQELVPLVRVPEPPTIHYQPAT